MGRFNKLPSPLIVISLSANAMIGVNILILNPLSSQLTSLFRGMNPTAIHNHFFIIDRYFGAQSFNNIQRRFIIIAMAGMINN